MPYYVAFLRAINVGGHTVKMDRLRALFEALGYTRVETVIASGNVLFDAPSADARGLEHEIERHLREALGYAVATFVRTPAELGAAARHDPFPEADPATVHAVYVAFLPAEPSEEARHRLMAFRSEADDFAVRGREVYWLSRTTAAASAFSGARLEKVLGLPATLRNVTTVRKLAARIAPEAA